MPPKPLAEDLARKKAEKDKKESGGGWGWFGNLIANPINTVKGVGNAAKETLFDPLNRAQKAVNPYESGTAMERAAGIAEGVLYAADMLTPGVPEGAMANSLRRRAMDRAVKANPSPAMQYGIHHSLTPGLATIRPSQVGNQVTALDAIPGSAYFWAGEGRDMTKAVDQIPFQWNNALWRRVDAIAEPAEFYSATPSAYLVRTPAGRVLEDMNVPGTVARRVEGSLPVVKDLTSFIDDPEAMRKALRHYGLRSRSVPDAEKIAERAQALGEIGVMRRLAETEWK